MSTPVPPRNRGKNPQKRASGSANAQKRNAQKANAAKKAAPTETATGETTAPKTATSKTSASKTSASKTSASKTSASKTSAGKTTARQGSGAAGPPPRGGGRGGSRPASGGPVPARPSRSGGRPSARQVRQSNQRRNRLMAGGIAGGVAIIAAVVIVVVVVMGGGGSNQVIPPAVNTQPITVEPPALKVANPTSIKGVVAYDTTGWPTDSNNGPAKDALGHTHVTGPVQYSVTPPVGGDHNPVWMNCGIYTKPVPVERAVHNLEHGAIWITYRPNLPKAEVAKLAAFVEKQSLIHPQGSGDSRYMDLTPFPGLPAPIVMSAWGFQLHLTSPTDPRMQQFVNTFRYTKKYSPEYPTGPCTGGVGTPAET